MCYTAKSPRNVEIESSLSPGLVVAESDSVLGLVEEAARVLVGVSAERISGPVGKKNVRTGDCDAAERVLTSGRCSSHPGAARWRQQSPWCP